MDRLAGEAGIARHHNASGPKEIQSRERDRRQKSSGARRIPDLPAAITRSLAQERCRDPVARGEDGMVLLLA